MKEYKAKITLVFNIAIDIKAENTEDAVKAANKMKSEINETDWTLTQPDLSTNKFWYNIIAHDAELQEVSEVHSRGKE